MHLLLADNLLTGFLPNTPKNKRHTFINYDVNNYIDISSIMTVYCVDYVFHYAAVIGVKRTTENPILVLEDRKGLQNIFP